MNRNLIIIIIIFPMLVSGQVFENFSDGDFTNNPAWTGDLTQFEVNPSKQLHLKSSGSDISYLSTTNILINNTEWRFYVKQSFNSSKNNNSRVYLVSDNSNLEGILNGYFVQIGESNDSISLCRQDSFSITKIIPGTIAYTGNSTNPISIKVLRDNSGNWELYSDPSAGNAFLLEGTAFDNTYSTTSFFGIYCKYTSSNSTKFYYDDFYVGSIMVDTIPPDILSIEVVSSISLDMTFSESLDKISAETIANYHVNNGIGNPSSALLDANDPSLVHLEFSILFNEGTTNTLTIKNIKDLEGNKIDSLIKTFVYYIVKTFDVIINEIMSDPEPVIGLPMFEYVELFNRTGFPINLKNWKITFGSSKKSFPDISIEADSFLILTKEDAVSLFEEYGPTLGIFTSSSSLSNSGTTIILNNSDGNIIHAVSYSDDWYADDNKQDGGWSLELIDPANPCGEKENWEASINITGGSPGNKNSVCFLNPDVIPPQIERVYIINTTKIQLFFSESLDSTRLDKTSNYLISQNIGYAISVEKILPHFKSVKLQLNESLKEELIYTLTISDTITDCVGNIMEINSNTRFAIAKPAETGDIVINEVLSNPKNNGVDFVEIVNRSDKVIDLKELTLSSYDNVLSELYSVKKISEFGYLVFPNEYYVLTKDPDIVKQQYLTTNPKGFLKMDEFPSFTNDDDYVVIANRNQKLIDLFHYTEDMHFVLLNTTKGVSLERININMPTNNSSNWHSAAESVGFATPAYKNSQSFDYLPIDDKIEVTPRIFSPDNDGYNDILKIAYRFDLPGYVANVCVFDARGRMVKTLIRNELLGVNGYFTWDGITDKNEKAPIGIYIIYIEIFDLKGKVKHYKKTAVLGGKLK